MLSEWSALPGFVLVPGLVFLIRDPECRNVRGVMASHSLRCSAQGCATLGKVWPGGVRAHFQLMFTQPELFSTVSGQVSGQCRCQGRQSGLKLIPWSSYWRVLADTHTHTQVFISQHGGQTKWKWKWIPHWHRYFLRFLAIRRPWIILDLNNFRRWICATESSYVYAQNFMCIDGHRIFDMCSFPIWFLCPEIQDAKSIVDQMWVDYINMKVAFAQLVCDTLRTPAHNL